MTRIHNFENMVRKHYVDCLIILDIMKARDIALPADWMDLGSGPGFPGIPLAIALPDAHFILAEGRKHRADFLEESAKLCGLKNVEVLARNIYPGSPIDTDAVITRAVESMPRTLSRLYGSIKDGGLMIFMKGPNCDEEIKTIQEEQSDKSRLLLDEAYTLPDSKDRRRLVIWKIRYPDSLKRAMEVKLKPALPLSSASNSKYKILKTLLSGRGIKKENQALLGGRRVIGEFLRERPEDANALIYPDKEDYFVDSTKGERMPRTDILADLNLPTEFAARIPFWAPAPALFKELDTLGTGAPLLLIRIPEIQDWNPARIQEGRTLFLPLSDPENLGAALRSAAAFAMDRVVLLQEAAHPYHPRAIRAAAGESFHLNLIRGPALKDLPAELAKMSAGAGESEGYPLYVLDRGGVAPGEIQTPENFGLLVGAEGGGVPAEFTDGPLTDDRGPHITRLTIPIDDRVESLNASVALGIALYALGDRA